MMKKYPDAVVLLNVRDPEAWYKSVMETVFYWEDIWNCHFGWFFWGVNSLLMPRLVKVGHFMHNVSRVLFHEWFLTIQNY